MNIRYVLKEVEEGERHEEDLHHRDEAQECVLVVHDLREHVSQELSRVRTHALQPNNIKYGVLT